MSHSVIPSLDIVRRALAAEIAYTISRMQVLERIPGNPLAIAYRFFDDQAVALMSRLPAFCRVVGMRAGHEPRLEPLLVWYRQHGLRPTFEAVPGMCDAALGRELTRLGLFQSGFHASLIGKPAMAPESGAAEIELVRSAAVLEDYLEAYVAGWDIAEAHQAQFKSNVRPWLGQAGWSLYLARVQQRPAAAATLYLHRGVGYFADAATHPAFRRRGLQLELLRRRLQDAGAAGAELVCSGAEPFSSSHRNMERAGMRLQFVRAKWTPM